MTTLGPNIKAFRKQKQLTQEQLGEIAGVSGSAVSQWESSTSEPTIRSIEKLAQHFGVPKSEIFGEQFAQPPKDAIPVIGDDSAFVNVRLYGSIAAGEAIEMIENYEWFLVPKPLVEKHPEVFLLTVKGKSMDTVLPDGSYALVDPQQIDVIDNQIYVVTVNGHDATVKKLVKLNNGMRLIPASTDPTFKEQLLDFNEPETEQLRIIGRVIWYTISFDHLTGE